MRIESKTLLRLPLAMGFALSLALAATPARAQYVYGVTALQLDPDFGRVYGYSATALDYAACYYYDAAVVGTLYEGSTAIDSGSYHGVCAAEVYTEGALQDDRLYAEVSQHYIIAYYYYYYYGGYYDPYGFFGFGSGDWGGGFNHYGCYCPAYFAQSNQNLGSTRVALFNQGPCNRTPALNGPASVTRGDSANFTLSNLCSTAQVSGWSFTEGNNTVSRGSSTATSWSGTMATGGTVRVNVSQGGQSHSLSKAITVNARSNFAFTAKTAEKKANGVFSCAPDTLQVPDPPTSTNRTFGQFLLCADFSFGFSSLGSGPNQGYRYVTSVTDNTVFGWTITPQLEDTGSDLYRAQCGRDGYISGAQLRANTVAHESGATNSHYSRYKAAQNDSANNVKAGLEPMVGPPSESEKDFQSRVETEGKNRNSAIITAAKKEPCGRSDVTLDESCTGHGAISYSPYRPCSPTSLNGQAQSKTRIDLSWSDGSFNETGFTVERRDPGASFATVATLAAGVTAYSDTTVTESKTYTYRVIAFNGTSTSPASNEASVTTPGNAPPPQRPGNLQGSASTPGVIYLYWSDDSGDEQGFKIQRSTAGGAFVEIAAVGAGVTSYADSAVAASTTYTYQVFAWSSAGGTSSASPQATVTTPPPGSAPTSPCCLWGQSYNGVGSVQISWSDQSANEDGFSLERSDGWGFYSVGWTAPNQTTWTDYGLQQGQSYVYRVVAENAYGQSFSEELYYYAPYWWEQ